MFISPLCHLRNDAFFSMDKKTLGFFAKPQIVTTWMLQPKIKEFLFGSSGINMDVSGNSHIPRDPITF